MFVPQPMLDPPTADTYVSASEDTSSIAEQPELQLDFDNFSQQESEPPEPSEPLLTPDSFYESDTESIFSDYYIDHLFEQHPEQQLDMDGNNAQALQNLIAALGNIAIAPLPIFSGSATDDPV